MGDRCKHSDASQAKQTFDTPFVRAVVGQSLAATLILTK